MRLGKYVVAAAAGTLAAVLLTVALMPAKTSAVKNEQVDGMVFWGTSNMSRLYGDMMREKYNEAGDRTGDMEVDQHVWASYHSADGSGYDYLNLGKFTQYTVNDASEYAILADWHSGWSATNPNDLRVSSGQSSVIGDTESQYWNFDSTGFAGKPADETVDVQGGSGGITSIYNGINEAVNGRGWDPKKTAVVIWAGEDWVVRNKESSDEGFVGAPTSIGSAGPSFATNSGQKILQVNWMGLDLEDNNNPFFAHNFNPAPWVNEVDPVGDIMHVYRDDNGNPEVNRVESLGSLQGSHYGKEQEEVKVCAFPNETNCNRLNDVNGKYSSGETGTQNGAWHHMYTFGNSYRVTANHMSDWQDAGNGLHNTNSGFSYTAGDDGIDLTLEHALEEETDKFPDGTNGTTKSSLPQQVGQCFGRVLSGYDYKVEYLVQDLSRTSSMTDREVTITYWDAVYTPEHEESHEEEDGSVTTETIPARYDWFQTTAVIHLRCDADLAPDPGYADSWHTHLYGGVDGMLSDLPDDPDAENYADHAHDYTPFNAWYTNPDKPIMKPVVETRHVKGYIEYWRHEFDPELMVYVFGLGPYNKSIYEDQKDENWLDGNDPADTGRDTNEDTFVDTKDRVNTNNAGTADMSSGAGPAFDVNHTDDWLISSSNNKWDLPANGGSGTPGFIDEIKRTDRIDSARKAFNTAVRSNLQGAKFVDIWDITLEHTPYFRYQDLISSGTLDQANAQHGKWYDQNTNNWIFHMMWSTILNDNPNPEPDEAIDISLYGVSAALTAYANDVLSPIGRDNAGTPIHTLLDVKAAGPAGAGAVLGYGDVDYGFTPFVTTNLSETSSVVDYKSLIGLEDASGGSEDTPIGSSMYLYARYGRLLQDMGIDKTAPSSSISPHLVPGLAMSVVYVANSGLSMIWEVTLDLLKTLNPFQFLHEASSISSAVKADMYDASDGLLVQLAARNEGVRKLLQEVGAIYDVLTGLDNTDASEFNAFTGGTPVRTGGYSFTVIMIYIVLFVAGFLLFYHSQTSEHRRSAFKVLMVRIVFICIGVPMLGVSYTAVLNGISDVMPVTAAPSSQMVAATFVDFAGWVKASRLSPPDGAVFKSVGDENSAAGHASDDTITSLRKTAWLINDSTGILPSVDMTAFSDALTDYEKWDGSILKPYEEAKQGMKSVTEVTAMLMEWTKGSYYFASDFESETMAAFSNHYHELVGRRKGAEEDIEATGWDNNNSLYQMFENTSSKDAWLGRDVADNTSIFTGSGDYAAGSAETDWSYFNIFANGALTADQLENVTADTTVTYSAGTTTQDPAITLTGTSMRAKTGLSTMSMYNYLVTDFGENSMSIYSAARTPNEHTSIGHYKTNLIGSGVIGVIFWLNCFAFLFAVAIVGFVYAFKMLISVIKRGFRMLLTIPGAMLGLMRSIVQVIAGVLMMIIEILATILMYGTISELMLAIVTAFEGPISDSLENVTLSSGLAGGVLGFVQQIAPDLAAGSAAAYLIFVTGTTIALAVGSFAMIKAAPAFLRVFDKLVELSFASLCTKEQAKVYLQPQEPKPEYVPQKDWSWGSCLTEVLLSAKSAKMMDC